MNMQTATNGDNMTTHKLDVFGIDVWGNEEDGWEQNDYWPVKRGIEVDENATELQILNALKDAGVVREDVNLNECEFVWYGEGFEGELLEAANQRPVYQFRNAAELPSVKLTDAFGNSVTSDGSIEF